jgi:hypothetical protein
MVQFFVEGGWGMYPAADQHFVRSLMTGLMESTRPAYLGGALLAIALVLVAVGEYRSGHREMQALRT